MYNQTFFSRLSTVENRDIFLHNLRPLFAARERTESSRARGEKSAGYLKTRFKRRNIHTERERERVVTFFSTHAFRALYVKNRARVSRIQNDDGKRNFFLNK